MSCVEQGELVWAADPITREWSLQEVVEPLVHDYVGDIITLEAAGEKIEATGNHPFWVVSGEGLAARPYSEHAGAQNHDFRFGKWVEARSVRVGDVVLLRSGETVKVASLSSRQASTKVYNIHVALLHSYAVGQAGVLVHNKGGEALVSRNKAVGDAARDRIAARVDGDIEQTFQITGGARRVDVLVGRTAIESKVGRTSLTPAIRQQIARDYKLIRQGHVDEVIWEFSKSPITGEIGPTGPLRRKLERLGLGIVE